MTDVEFASLDPRKRDALVAEKVMGRMVTWLGWEPDRVPMFQSTLDANEERREDGRMPVGYPGDGDVPYYGTCIGDAWEVVEKMRGDEDFALLADFQWMSAADVALYVCIAALKAKGEIE